MKKTFFIIFSDLKGFSKLNDEEMLIFQKKVLSELKDVIKYEKKKSAVWNTWGDAIFTAFEDGNIATDFMMKYRDFFKSYDFKKVGMRKIIPRIAGHFGQAEIFKDPILGAVNLYGVNINTTARIEPVTRAGEIFVTKDFKYNYELMLNKGDVGFEELGTIKLAKSFGELEVFRLKKSIGEKVFDEIAKKDSSINFLNVPSLIDEEAQKKAHKNSLIYKFLARVKFLYVLCLRIFFSLNKQMILMYRGKFKKSALIKLLPLENSPILSVAKAIGLSNRTIYNWQKIFKKDDLSLKKESITSSIGRIEKFHLLLEGKTILEEESGKWLKEKGLHSEHLKLWEQELVDFLKGKETELRQENKMLKQDKKNLEKELSQKDKALSEMAALLVFKKKVHAFWGDVEEI